jgi:hypothetical protein
VKLGSETDLIRRGTLARAGGILGVELLTPLLWRAGRPACGAKWRRNID